MASYRYERDIDPKDIAPRKERQYTRKERWANWWDYNLKWVIIIGIAAAFAAYNFIGQYFFVTKPDYNVAVVAPYYLPEDTVNALQDALAAYGEDRNGDGKVVVTLNVYTLDYSDTETQTESAAYLTMAGTTIPHDVIGEFGAGRVMLKPAPEGTGIIAGGAVRAVMEAAGISNIRAKCLRSNNPQNVVKATMQGLMSLRDAAAVARIRGKSVEEIVG